MSAGLLVPNIKMSSGATNKDEPMVPIMAKKYKKYFNSFVFVHDALSPDEVLHSLVGYL